MSQPNTDRRNRVRGHQDVDRVESRSDKRAANAAARREANAEAASAGVTVTMRVLRALMESGIVYPAGRELVPQKCDYIPRNAKDFKGPVGISYDDIDQAVLDGYIQVSLHDGIYTVYWLYKGREFYWRNGSRAQRQYIHDWRQRNKTGRYSICCMKALPVRCVCFISTDCPDHGGICQGTHD